MTYKGWYVIKPKQTYTENCLSTDSFDEISAADFDFEKVFLFFWGISFLLLSLFKNLFFMVSAPNIPKKL